MKNVTGQITVRRHMKEMMLEMITDKLMLKTLEKRNYFFSAPEVALLSIHKVD